MYNLFMKHVQNENLLKWRCNREFWHLQTNLHYHAIVDSSQNLIELKDYHEEVMDWFSWNKNFSDAYPGICQGGGALLSIYLKCCLKVNFHIFNVQSRTGVSSHASCLVLWTYQEAIHMSTTVHQSDDHEILWIISPSYNKRFKTAKTF